MKEKKANEQLLNETNISKNYALKQWEEEFNKIKDIYCANDINSMNISEEIEDLFYILYKNENIKNIYLKEI